MTNKTIVPLQTKVRTLAIAMSRVNGFVFTLAGYDGSPDLINSASLLHNPLQLQRCLDLRLQVEDDLAARLLDLGSQALELCDEIEQGELHLPWRDEYRFALCMLGLALLEFDNDQSVPGLHGDAATLGPLWPGSSKCCKWRCGERAAGATSGGLCRCRTRPVGSGRYRTIDNRRAPPCHSHSRLA